MTVDKRFEKGDRMREIILMTAIRLISESGIEGVSAAKIAAACDISKSNVFHHFKTIDAILLAVNEMVFEMSLKAIDIDAPNLDVFLERLLMGMLNIGSEARMIYNSFFAFYNRGLYEPKLNVQLREAIAKLQDKLTEHLFYHTLKPAGVNVKLSEIDQAPEYLRQILKSVEHACKTCAVSLFAFMDGLALQLLLNSHSSVSQSDAPTVDLTQHMPMVKSAIAFQILCVKQHLKHPL